MFKLTDIDYILIVIYFVILLIIGYFISKKSNLNSYLIADRNLNIFESMSTINASKTGSILLTFVALTYLWGFSAVWYFIGVIIGVLLFIPFALKLKTNSNGKYYTLSHYFKDKFGKKSAFLASLLSIALMFGLSIINIIAAAKIFQFFTNFPFWICALLISLIIMIYLLWGGFKAVAKTDIIQYLSMIFILIFLVIILFDFSKVNHLDWNFFKINLFTLVGFFLIGVMFPFASPDLWQRVYATENKIKLKKSLLLSTIIYFIFGALLSIIALTIKYLFPNINPDIALLHGFVQLLPNGLIGLALILFFSAIMSTLDTYLFTGSSAIIQDFFNFNKKKTVQLIKITIILFTIIATIIAILIKNLVIGSYIFAAFYAVISIPVIITWIKPQIKEKALMFSFSFGIIATIIALFFFLIQGEIQPMIVIISIISSLFGLLFFNVFSLIKKIKMRDKKQ